MENEVNVMDELNKGASMGMDAVNYILEHAKDKGFIKVLNKLATDYQEILDSISNIYPEYSNKEPHETNAISKLMTWTGIEMKTIVDDSTSHLAELVANGINMGIIEGRRILNQKELNSEVKPIAEKYVSMQENGLEDIKKFL